MAQYKQTKDDRLEEAKQARETAHKAMEENAELLVEVARHTDKIEELGQLLQVCCL